MSTHSVIGIIHPNQSVECITCHFDGYLEINGRILYQHYQDVQKVNQLMKLGNLTWLSENIEPPKGEEHSYDKPYPDTTLAYMRDRHEKNQESVTLENFKEFMKEAHESDCEYIYVYDTYNNEWLCNTPMMNPYEYDFLKKILEQELGMSEEEFKYEQKMEV